MAFSIDSFTSWLFKRMPRASKRVNRFSQPLRAIRPDRRSPPLSIQRITVTRIGITSVIQIHPSQAYVKAKDIIAMIEKDQNHLITNSGEWVQSREILAATEGLLDTATPQGSTSTDTGYNFTETKEKRVANAFMRYRSAHARKLHSLFPEYTPGDISKFLGAVWRIVPKDVKDKYQQQWKDSREEQVERFPDYNHNSWKKNRQQQHTSSEASYLDSGAFDVWHNFDIDNSLFDPSLGSLPSYNSAIPIQDPNMDINELINRLNASAQTTTTNEFTAPVMSPHHPAATAANPNSDIEDWQALCNFITGPYSEIDTTSSFPWPAVDNATSLMTSCSDSTNSNPNTLASFPDFPDFNITNPPDIDTCNHSNNVHYSHQ